MPATLKMIVFAKKIADTLDIEEPDYDDYEDTSEFIEDNKDDYYEVKSEFSEVY